MLCSTTRSQLRSCTTSNSGSRLVLLTDKELPEHAVAGPITMHCLKGAIDVTAHGSCKTMRTGDFLYLAGKVPHMLRATKDASALMIITLQKLST